MPSSGPPFSPVLDAWSMLNTALPELPAATSRSCAMRRSACSGGTGDSPARSPGPVGGGAWFSMRISPTFSRSGVR